MLTKNTGALSRGLSLWLLTGSALQALAVNDGFYYRLGEESRSHARPVTATPPLSLARGRVEHRSDVRQFRYEPVGG